MTIDPGRTTGAARRLIITADDYGRAQAVNEAVEIAHRDGVLTSASLMVGEPAFADAVERAHRRPGLRVGLHLTLTDGAPTLPPERIPHLVGADGRFKDEMAAAGAMMFFHPAARLELAAEIEAQFAAFAGTGLALDHVNAHKHFHLHPTIAGAIIRIGPRYGLRAVRAPIEPARPLRAIEPTTRTRADLTLLAWSALARARFRGAGLLTPDQVFGLRWSGAMTAPRLAGLIGALPAGLTEIYLHPSVRGDFKGAASGYGYAEELEALTSPLAIEALKSAGVASGGFADFAP